MVSIVSGNLLQLQSLRRTVSSTSCKVICRHKDTHGFGGGAGEHGEDGGVAVVVAHGVDHAEVGEVVLEIDTVRGVVT